jgi:hypothetical protein
MNEPFWMAPITFSCTSKKWNFLFFKNGVDVSFFEKGVDVEK